MKHPMQKVYRDGNGTFRFVENQIVRYLLDEGRLNLNDLARVFYDSGEDARQDFEQFAQLIGYSLSGFSDLSYVSDEAYELAEAESEKLPGCGAVLCVFDNGDDVQEELKCGTGGPGGVGTHLCRECRE